MLFYSLLLLQFTRRLYLILTGGSTFRVESLLPVALYTSLVIIYSLSQLSSSITAPEGDCDKSNDNDGYCHWGMQWANINSLDVADLLLLPFEALLCCYAVASWTFMTISLGMYYCEGCTIVEVRCCLFFLLTNRCCIAVVFLLFRCSIVLSLL